MDLSGVLPRHRMLMSRRDELTVRCAGWVHRRGKVENCFKAAGTSTGCECEIAWNKIEAVVPDGHVSPQPAVPLRIAC